ncbi:BRO family protein [Prevotella amnii]|uniref:BRO family protein n=1 Tax=Prevotella amnii TaxID=419005 RepID=A0A134B593_9BACT|nr:phage antirepressor KilAC domain-containing protein [Prevotella amnii]KXB75118.1 BRO family protein [Prevotella amnii]
MENQIQIQVLKQTELCGQQFQVYGTPQEPLFVAKDVACVIEHSDVSTMMRTVDEDEKLVQTIFVSGQNREVWMLTENGLYEVLMQSRKPIAKKFKKGVKTILKEIRTNGGYLSTTHEDTPELIMAKALRLAQATIEKRQRELEQVKECVALQAEQLKQSAPKAEAFEKYIDSTCYISANQIAKEYGWGAVTLNKHLHELGIQYKQCDQWLLYSQYDNNGYTVSRPYTFVNKDGEVINRMSTYWTAKGREFIHSVLYKRLNVVPLGQQHDYNN